MHICECMMVFIKLFWSEGYINQNPRAGRNIGNIEYTQKWDGHLELPILENIALHSANN